MRIHQAAELARAEARHWQATFDAISDGVCLLDRDGTVLRCNHALTRLTGQPAGELIGRDYRELTPEASGHALPFEPMRTSVGPLLMKTPSPLGRLVVPVISVPMRLPAMVTELAMS